VRSEDPGDLARVAGDLKRDPIARRQTRREQLQRLRRRLNPADHAHPAGLRDRDHTEVAMRIDPDRSGHNPPPRR
jgi:hypothetical protein